MIPRPNPIVPGAYRTRDGRKAVVLCTDAPGPWPCKGYIATSSRVGATSHGWTFDGYDVRGELSPDDLDAEWQERKSATMDVWVWLSADGSATEYPFPPTDRRCRSWAPAKTIGYKKVTVTVTEGDVDD